MNTASKWTRFRILLTGLLFVALAFFIGRKAWELQVDGAARYLDMAENNYLREIEIPPGRGRILDRRGKEFASTVEVQSVFGNPRALAYEPGAARKLARALNTDYSLIKRRLSSRRFFAWLKRRATPDEEKAVHALRLPGVGFRPEPQRFYPLRDTGSTIIGYAGTSGVGLEGVELAYDKYLRGTRETLQGVRDSSGRELLVEGIEDTSASKGNDVRLALDAYLTMVAENALQRVMQEHNAKAATAVVIDPKNGQVLAMANTPSYNPNQPGSASADGARNRAVTDSFEPGSTMKTFTFAAVMDRGKVKADDWVDCEKGRMKVGRYTIRDTHPLGAATAAEVYQQSSNIGTVKIARRIDKNDLYKTLQGFGFGSRAGVGLPGEQSGILRPTTRWGDIGFANVAFGQGLTATPLQITAGFAAIAAGGIYRPPRVALAVVKPDGSEQALWPNHPDAQKGRRVISEKTAHNLLEIMAGVPTKQGTARRAAIPGYRAAGKTGTAQKVRDGKYDKDLWFASFVGIVPVDDPQLVIGVFVDEPNPVHLGGMVAAPAFREIAEAGLKYLNISPTEAVSQEDKDAEKDVGTLPNKDGRLVTASQNDLPPEGFAEGPGSDAYVLSDEEFFPIDPELPAEEQIEMITVPRLVGKSIAQVLREGDGMGLRIVPEGSGVAYFQDPPANRQVPQGAPVRVVFRPGG